MKKSIAILMYCFFFIVLIGIYEIHANIVDYPDVYSYFSMVKKNRVVSDDFNKKLLEIIKAEKVRIILFKGEGSDAIVESCVNKDRAGMVSFTNAKIQELKNLEKRIEEFFVTNGKNKDDYGLIFEYYGFLEYVYQKKLISGKPKDSYCFLSEETKKFLIALQEKVNERLDNIEDKILKNESLIFAKELDSNNLKSYNYEDDVIQGLEDRRDENLLHKVNSGLDKTSKFFEGNK